MSDPQHADSLFVPPDDQSSHLESSVNLVTSNNYSTTVNTGINDLLAERLEQQVEDDDENLVNTRINPIDVSINLTLKYQQKIVQEMVSEDGLLILGKGLGLEYITANLLHVLSSSTTIYKSKKKKSLVLLINATESENERICQDLIELSRDNSFNETRQFITIGGDSITAQKRKQIYERGGIVSITNRLLVVDLLSEIVSPSLITGLIILHAERVSETSNDSFIINLYREKNNWGFIKALSDEPQKFCIGFQPLYTKLKIMKLENTFLWPRFHVDVSASLISKPTILSSTRTHSTPTISNAVSEINVKMTESMKQIQIGLLACIEACIGELRRHNPQMLSEYWSIENALEEDFVRAIRRTLDPVWHRISNTTKQVVYDLSVLKELLNCLFTYDSIRFYEMLNHIVEMNKPSSLSRHKSMAPWLMLDEAMNVINYAKNRVFKKIKDKSIHPNSNSIESTYLLEELPKWEQLSIILDDINHEKQFVNYLNDGPVLIMCSSVTVCNQLNQYISTLKELDTKEYDNDGNSYDVKMFSGRKLMVRKLREHLIWKNSMGNTSENIQKVLQDDIVAQQSTSTTTTAVSTNDNHDNRNRANDPQDDDLVVSKTFMKSRVPSSKRRRTRGAAVIASAGRFSASSNVDSDSVDTNMVNLVESQLAENEIEDDEDNDDDDEDDNGNTGNKEPAYEDFIDDLNFLNNDINDTSFGLDLNFELIDTKDEIIIERYDNKNDDSLLQELMPSVIILYEPDLSFIRRVESYQATRRDAPAKTYFMYYGSSTEEEKYLSSIKKEKESFTKLIREKASMSKHFATADDNSKLHINKSHVLNTRIAGGSNKFRTPLDELKVIVDIREFRSSLPNLCHKIGMKVLPCMLTVGDYVISKKICIERKSIPDLIGSFKSGRLYQQCEQMFRYYEIPALLIEFEEGKSFSLEPFAELRTKVNQASLRNDLQQDIQMKIIMLLTAFPKLKIIWSSSSLQTAQIIMELKSSQEEPDVDKAIQAGLEKNSNLNDDNDGSPAIYNDNAIDLIQHIPGITAVNYHLIISKVKNINQLSKLPLQELTDLIGSEAAKKVRSFFTKNVSKI
ncbi:nucleic acid binding protein [[Candida] boidinii]|nr:nucleic acid binding protein [[Candida] boidinii]